MPAPDAYDRIEFWQSYADLYMPSAGFGQNAREELAKRLAKLIPKLKKDEPKDTPVRVLCLGIGIGLFELPILNLVERDPELNGRPVHIVGVDRAELPLRIVSQLVRNGLSGFPRTRGEFDEALFQAEKAVEIAKPTKKVVLLKKDLDRSEEVTFTAWPSNWREDSLISDHKYDLIMASFCFFHLHYWKFTLIEALKLLKDNGVLTHPAMEGDGFLFEGKTSNIRFLSEGKTPGGRQRGRAREPRPYLNRVMDEFCGAPENSDLLSDPHSYSATKSLAFEHFLNQFKPHGIEAISWLPIEEQRSNTVTFATLYNLFNTRGFSSFRKLENQIGEPKNTTRICRI